MWQVLTSPQQFEVFAESERGLFSSEIDDLLAALAALQPIPARQPRTLSPFKATTGDEKVTPLTRTREIISTLEIPRTVNAPDNSMLPPEVREPLLNLRATIMLAAEREGLRSVLLCGADAQATTAIAAHLSQLLAEYERLKVAYLEVSEESPTPTVRRKMLPSGYTFQLRRTRQTNLYEIASSLGVVRLDDWLRW